jgi:hypothetical protein
MEENNDITRVVNIGDKTYPMNYLPEEDCDEKKINPNREEVAAKNGITKSNQIGGMIMRDPENLIGQAVKKIMSNIGKKVKYFVKASIVDGRKFCRSNESIQTSCCFSSY